MEDEGEDRHAEMRFSQDLPPDSPARRFSYEPRGRASLHMNVKPPHDDLPEHRSSRDQPYKESLRSEPRNRETNATDT